MYDAAHSLLVLTFPVILGGAAVWDARALRIPNVLSIVLLLAFFPAAGLAGLEMQVIAWHVGVALMAFIVLAVMFAFGLLGGGDVKLFAATALWLGAANMVAFVLVVTIAGGLLSLALLVGHKVVGDPAEGDSWLKRRFNRAHNVPYGIAIAVGGWALMGKMAVLPQGWHDLAAVMWP